LIKSFKSKDTAALFDSGVVVPQWQSFARVARRKLLIVEAAKKLSDLKAPPGNQLEALKGNRKGQHSIRINDQYRICFVWSGDGAENVEIVDYH
jgi:toxin HigB-1